MIVSQLKGRLGNQMFQYAAGRALAERNATVLVLDTSWILEAKQEGEQLYELGVFDHGAEVRPVWEVARVPNPRRWRRVCQRLRPTGDGSSGHFARTRARMRFVRTS